MNELVTVVLADVDRVQEDPWPTVIVWLTYFLVLLLLKCLVSKLVRLPLLVLMGLVVVIMGIRASTTDVFP